MKRLMFAAPLAIALGTALVAAQTAPPPSTAPQSTSPTAGARKPGDYPLGPDSLPQDGVPKGKLEGPYQFRSQIIPNTVRRYWVYVPAQYNGDRPANVLVFRMDSGPRIRMAFYAYRRCWRT